MSLKRKLNKLLKLISVVGLLSSLEVYAAEKMDLEAHDLVIGKLESTLKNIKKNDQTINSVLLKIQLANLYSEKARLLILEEGKQGCDNCLQSLDTRNKAITLYTSVSAHQLDQDGGLSSLQLAYLLETTNKGHQALPIYNRLIKNKTTTKPNLIKAYSKRAEHYFREGLFNKSISDFQTAQSLAPQSEYSYFLHKIAWAQYNKGEIEKATDILFLILSKKPPTSQSNENEITITEGFRIDVARDLALFITKLKVSPQFLSRVFEVTPPSERSRNLLYFSEESERLGDFDNAVMAWEILIKAKDTKEEPKISAFLGLARYHRDRYHFSKANSYYLNALQISKKASDLNVNNFKVFLTQWEKQIKKFTKKEKIKESQKALVQAYDHYLQSFNENYEVYLWQAQLAQKINQSDKALASYSRASDLIANQINKDKSSTANNELRKLLNEVLVTEVSLAENSKNSKLRLIAYNHYLSLYPSGPEGAKVRYQKAKLFYDSNDTTTAFELFNEIVVDSSYSNQELKVKSAHLALDCLALKKDIVQLEVKSLEYAKKFPHKESEFIQIAFNSGMQITNTIASRDNSKKTAEEALDKLNGLHSHQKSMKPSDRKKYLATKVELEIKAHQWKPALNSLSDFLALKSINSKEKTWALNKKLSIAEFILDFKMAYQTLLQLNYLSSKDPKELLKGALIAELAQYPILPWLNKVIKSPQSSQEQINLARAQIIRMSSNPWKALRELSPHLKKSPQLFASIALECFTTENRWSEIPWILSFSGVKNTSEGKTLQRVYAMKDLKVLDNTLASQSLNSRNDAQLAKSLKKRLSSLQTLQSQFKKAQQNNDWSLKVLLGVRLQNENQRLATEIESLPVPAGMKPKQITLYKKELSQQAWPFKKARSELSQYLENLWKDKSYLTSLLRTIDTNDRIRGTLMKELSAIASVAPTEIVNEVQNQLNEFKNRPSSKEIAQTQLSLQKDPFDPDLHSQLLMMEKKRGNQSMVVFLQARGQNIRGGHL